MLFAVILIGSHAISAQTATDSAVGSQPTANAQTSCQDNLKSASRMLGKTLDVLEKCETAKNSETRRADNAEEKTKLLEQKNSECAAGRVADRSTIKRLEEIKCTKTYYFFGLFKTKKCY